MRRKLFAIPSTIIATFILLACALTQASPALHGATPSAPNVVAAAPVQPGLNANGVFSVNKAPRGETFQGAVILGIPNGFHINSNRPTNKFMIPTRITVTGPRGVRIGPIRYPRANVRSFAFAPDERLPVFEGNPAMRFDVTLPAGFAQDRLRLRVVVAYQACSDDTCFRPSERDITVSIPVAGPDDKIERINRQVFGGSRRK